MQNLQLDTEELTETTYRAQEIASQIEASGGNSALEERYAAYLSAAEEMGIPREAALQALRERLQIHEVSVDEGDRIFAPSADGFWYAATVKSVNKHKATVVFDVGGELTCDVLSLRPFSLAPGTIVHALWKGDQGWYGARVRKYDTEKQRVEVVYRMDGTTETVPLKRIRLFAEGAPSKRSPYQILPSPLLDLLLKVSASGAVGFLIAWLLK
jgi:hypothetical protein